MKTELKQVVLASSVCTVAALFAACSGDGGSSDGGLGVYTGKTTPAAISESSVKEDLNNIKDFFPSCTATFAPETPAKVAEMIVGDQLKSVLPVVKIAQSMVLKASAKTTVKSVSLLPTIQPKNQIGDCGGSMSYPTYSHLSGTTTVTVKYDNYCTVDSITGNKKTMNGTINAVDAGTPGTSGPVTNKVTANTPSITVEEKTSAGALVSSTTIAMSGFEYIPKPGTSANISDPLGTTKVTALEVKTIDGTKKETQLKLVGLNAITDKSGTDSTLAISGTACRGTSGCSDFTTATTPFVLGSGKNLKSGQITFTGANKSTNTLTAVPGSIGQKFSVSVNGKTLDGAQLACGGL